MATEQTENAANADFANGLTVPETGDDYDAVCNATLPQLFQQVGDRFQALRNAQPGLAATATIWVPMAATVNVNSRFTAIANFNGTLGYSQTSVTDGGSLVFPVAGILPRVGQITSIRAYWSGNGVHSGEPATKPDLTLFRAASTFAAETNVASVTDPYGSDGVYDAVHQIAATGLSHVIDPAYTYHVRFRGETGANSATGSILYGIQITVAP